jgi:amino acid adenylation domain-containing protein/non-ribosomal peptide synthase protein (TIGR01720 family)
LSQETIQGYRLSPPQRHLWLSEQSAPAQPFRVRCLVGIAGELDREILCRALESVVADHEILRTTFQLLPGMTVPVQVIAETASVSVRDHDLSELGSADRAAALDKLFADTGNGIDNFARLPLLCVDLIKESDKRHGLLLSAPAICVDALSMQRVVVQVAAVYQALQQEETPATCAAMQYADFAEWQNELLESPDGAAARQFWQRAELFATQRLPFEQDNAGFVPVSLPLEIPPGLLRRVRETARNCSVSLATFLHGCWQLALWRSTGSENVNVGVSFAGRKFAELEDAVGLLSCYLPLVAAPANDLKFADFLTGLSERQADAELRQEYFSFPDQAESAYFPFCFESREWPTDVIAGGLTFSWQRQDCQLDRFKIKFVCDERNDTVTAELQYNGSLFAAAEMQRLARRLETLIESAARSPQSVLADLDVLGAEEKRLLLTEFNDTQTTFPLDMCVHQLFEQQAEGAANSSAVVFEESQLTFVELNRRANQLAHRLRKLGVGPDVRVGLCLERSVDLIVGLLGILKAGGAYVPLDPGLPPARLGIMLEDAGARIMITRAHLAAGLHEHLDQVVCFERDRELLAAESTENLSRTVAVENLAYIIFTSGSTGRPKGVAVEHRQIANYVRAIWRELELPAGSTFAMVSTIAADLGNTVLFPALAMGGTLHLISEERATSPDSFADYCRDHPIDCLKIVPSHLSALFSAANPADVLPRERLVLGGEASPWSLIEKIATLAPECLVINHYGPTEGTVGVTAGRVNPAGAGRAAKVVPLGRPLANTQVYILDRSARLSPLGAPGELHLGGAGLARGYVGRGDATAEKFIPNPFGAEGTRLYKTGDLARHLPDGRLEFLGRIDDQVKIHGYRIEPAEIAQALREHPDIKESAVVVREDQPGEKRLVAYVVVLEHASKNAAELKTFLRGKLPEYMVPLGPVFLESLPLTANGKVDRQALPAPERLPTRSATAPRNQIEETLATIWAGVLGITELGVHDNFFELGGDSILSIQIIARANQAGLKLSPRQLFQHQTIAELGAVAGTTATVTAEQGVISGPVPLTPIQMRFLSQNQVEPHHYNQALMLSVAGPIDLATLERAIRELLVHHDALRSRFTRSGNTWQQRVSVDENFTLAYFDLSHMSAAEQPAALQEGAASLQSDLNLTDGPIFRAALFKLGDQRARLLLVVHHLAVDGVSWGVLLEDLQTLYRQFSNGEKPALPSKTTSFKSWAEQLVAYAGSDALRAETSYWLSLFSGQIPRLPVDRNSGPNNVASARTVTVSLNADDTRALLQEIPVAYRTQINEILLTALARTLSRWTSSRVVLLDLEGHGREELFPGVDLSRTVGWFTTIFPVVIDLSDSSNCGDALRLVKEQLRAIPERGIGYGLLRYASNDGEIVARLNSQPQAEIRFNYLGQTDRSLPKTAQFKPAADSVGPSQSPKGERGYLLNVIGAVTGGELRLEWTYSENIHCRETIEQLAQNYLEQVLALIAQSRTSVSAAYSPSDFPRANLSQKDLEKVLSRLKQS